MLTICSRIVVPYDQSELSKQALETAITLAKQDERVELNVITVINTQTAVYNYVTFDSDPVRQAQLAEAKEMLNEVKEKLSGLPNKARTFIIEGSPAMSIVDFIVEENADLVVMGSRGLGGLKELFLGSVSHYVVQKSPCPVFIVK
ncbi:universal stress protein [Neobacillus niacini]|uniref:universal stress protein n=1 Tax=Neobacillus niacini TaxID=86668 RepID=UPI00285CD8C9|nr:universal stress protein [Neobacillus niacini]MDR6998963.1 nucleotide-binding universal stress UspA family protein [Neobacillus niacini]